MGEVLEFPSEKVVRTSGKSLKYQQTATILVFEGVQYSSHEPDGERIIKCPVARPHT